MRRVLLVLLTAGAALAFAAPASAETRCYTPHVLKFDSFEVCYDVPVGP